MSNQGKKDTDDSEEIFDLRPAEVTLTGAPAVREDFLMTKAEVTLNDLELHGLASKLGVDGIEAIPEVEVKKAITLKTEEENAEAKKRLEEEEEDPDKKGKVPPQFMKKADDDDDDEDEEKELNLGKSRVIRDLAPAILTAKADLPKSLVRALEKSVAEDEAAKGDGKDDTAKTETLAEAIKSEMPGLVSLLLAPQQAEIKKHETRIAQMEADVALVGFTEIAKSMLGDPEKVAARLAHLSKSMSKADYDAFVEEQQGFFKTLEESDLLKSVQGRAVDATDPISAVQAKAEAEIAKSGKSGDPEALANALIHVLDSEPAMANAYHREMENRAAAR